MSITSTRTRTFTHMISCTRRLQFCAGHRVFGHEGKCRHMHGHNYVALITAEASKLDIVGRVIDFSVLKEKIGGWIDEHWDHGFIFWRQDEEMSAIFSGQHCWSKHYALDQNPTAENMAEFLLNDVCPALLHGSGVRVTEVTLWETENCYATAKQEIDEDGTGKQNERRFQTN